MPDASTIFRRRVCFRPGKVERIRRPVLHDDIATPHLTVRFIADIELLHATVEAIVRNQFRVARGVDPQVRMVVRPAIKVVVMLGRLALLKI